MLEAAWSCVEQSLCEGRFLRPEDELTNRANRSVNSTTRTMSLSVAYFEGTYGVGNEIGRWSQIKVYSVGSG